MSEKPYRCNVVRKTDEDLPNLHKDINGCQCTFLITELCGMTCAFITVPNTNSGEHRLVRTSPVVCVTNLDDDMVVVETENSIYTFT